VNKAATQTERIVRAAKGARGICRVDFQLPDVIDGGDPILNFPGRMYDAERAGHCFEVIGKRHRCKVFRLIEDGVPVHCEPPAPIPTPRRAVSASPYDSALHDEHRAELHTSALEERVEDLQLLISDFFRGVRTEDELLAEANR
jgi:hypothetical protein